jgi:hypothetical protein
MEHRIMGIIRHQSNNSSLYRFVRLRNWNLRFECRWVKAVCLRFAVLLYVYILVIYSILERLHCPS